MAAKESFNAIFNDTITQIKNNREYADILCPAIKVSRMNIIIEYGRLNKFVKDNFMQANDEPLDRHKCAAAFMVAILTKLEIDRLEQNPKISKLIKEKIAIEIGLSVMITMIKKKIDDIENVAIINYWNNNNNTINFPPSLCDKGDYVKNWALGLYYARKENKLFALSLANDLFLIESYNREHIK
jgi:hypothetical protein